MKTNSILFTATASLLAVIAFAADQNPASSEHSMPPETAADMKAFHEKALATYDADKNGMLSPDERTLLHDDIRSRKFPIPSAVRQHIARLLGRGPGGDGTVPPEILAKYDTNKDGKLDEKEHVAFAVDIASGKAEPPHPHTAAPARGARKAPGS